MTLTFSEVVFPGATFATVGVLEWFFPWIIGLVLAFPWDAAVRKSFSCWKGKREAFPAQDVTGEILSSPDAPVSTEVGDSRLDPLGETAPGGVVAGDDVLESSTSDVAVSEDGGGEESFFFFFFLEGRFPFSPVGLSLREALC